MGTVLAACATSRAANRRGASWLARSLAVVAFWIPVAQCYLFQSSSTLGIANGPWLTELATYFPLLFVAVYAAAGLLGSIDLGRTEALQDLFVALVSYGMVWTAAGATRALLPSCIGMHAVLTRVGLQLLVGVLAAVLAPSLVLVLAVPAVLHAARVNPHFPSAGALSRASAALASTTNFTLLARHESITGYLSVVQSGGPTPFRVLRCDHSLLGGEWLVTPHTQARGQTQREPVFTVFVMLEAVRLVEAGPAPRADAAPPSALVIGLGIGTAPNALMAHGVATTIVELDPAVHALATRFFGLAPAHRAELGDAVDYVARAAATAPASFDYIVHDVFTGGAEPTALFTADFLGGLRALLAPRGVVAINYAGDLALPATRLVLATVHAVFPACRLFRDSADERAGGAGADFINMVVFCVARDGDGGRGRGAIRFRAATEADFLGSLARRRGLRPLDELEIAWQAAPGDGQRVLRHGSSAERELAQWQQHGAVSHWRIMRDVLPAAVWEAW